MENEEVSVPVTESETVSDETLVVEATPEAPVEEAAPEAAPETEAPAA
jgi:hypothetical protein